MWGNGSQPDADLDQRTFSFVVKTSEPIEPGETVIIRRVRQVPEGLEVHAVTVTAIKEEADKLAVD